MVWNSLDIRYSWWSWALIWVWRRLWCMHRKQKIIQPFVTKWTHELKKVRYEPPIILNLREVVLFALVSIFTIHWERILKINPFINTWSHRKLRFRWGYTNLNILPLISRSQLDAKMSHEDQLKGFYFKGRNRNNNRSYFSLNKATDNWAFDAGLLQMHNEPVRRRPVLMTRWKSRQSSDDGFSWTVAFHLGISYLK